MTEPSEGAPAVARTWVLRAAQVSRPVGAGAPDPALTGFPRPDPPPSRAVRRRSVSGLAVWWEVALLVLAALVVTEVAMGVAAGGGGGGRVPVVRHLVKVDPLPLASEGGGGG